MKEPFPDIRFRGELRPSQKDVVGMVRDRLKNGEKKFHIVAPPGSGKTVTGLYLWAEVIRKPTLVLSPTSAIQSQWIARTDLFSVGDWDLSPEWVSLEPEEPALLSSFTYQSVTLPSRGNEAMDQMAIELWNGALITSGQAHGPDEAQTWIEDLKVHNRDYYDDRLSHHRKIVRRDLAASDDMGNYLHESARSTLRRLRETEIGLIILDECHHLLQHWGRVLAAVNEYLGDPILLGLTATPPDDATKDNEDARRYREYFGPVDYEVPVPAVIKDGFLAPYQDLAYFVRPNSNELNFVAQTSEAMDALISELCNPPKDKKGQPVRESLQDYAERILANTELPTRKVSSWLEFENMAPSFALSARLFLYHRGQSFPEGVPELSDMVLMQASDPLEQVVPLLSWYVRNRLRASPEFADHDLAERVIKRLRIMGIQITETGTMHCASPVTRVLAYSRAKAQALIPILKEEIKVLGDTIRAVVLCDYEKTAAIAGEISHVLDEEAGGAIAAFRELLNDEETDALNPVLLTGSTVFVDDDFKPTLEQAIREWLSEKGKSVDFTWGEESGFYVLLGKGSDWCPRVYVEMFTELFLSGLTRCLVGTRGLLAEGWDAKKINVLLDLTCVSTSTAVNQLRGRSFRLDPDVPEKLANNWDVVCIAPEFTRGMDDYRRFRRKHKQIFGVTDGGAIEKGVGHVHPGFKERGVEGIEDNMAMLNRDMLERVAQRAHFRGLWRIGEPYHPEPIKAVEIKGACDEPPGAGFNFPPLKHRTAEWTDGTLTQEIGRVILLSLAEIGMVDQDNVSEIIERISVAERTGGYTRVFLEEVDEKTSDLFAQAIAEVFGPLTKARYVIPRVADVLFRESWFSDTWFYRVLPQDLSSIIVKKTLRDKYRRQIVKFHALPRELGRNKERALVYQKHWNEHVSPGEVLFQGKNFKQVLLEEIQRMSDLPRHAAKLSDEAKIEGLLPSATVNVKEVFI